MARREEGYASVSGRVDLEEIKSVIRVHTSDSDGNVVVRRIPEPFMET